MANPVSTFVELFVQTPDPYVPRGTVLTGFATGANAHTPAQLWGDCTSDQYPMVLLMAGADSRPIVATAPFTEQQLPPASPLSKGSLPLWETCHLKDNCQD